MQVKFLYTFRVILLVALISGASLSDVMSFENTVIVESKTVIAGTDSVWVGISISNDFPVSYIFLPLEVRAMTPGAFISEHAALFDNPKGRVASSGLSEDQDACWPWPSANPSWHFQLGISLSNNCSGPVSNSYTNAYYDSAPFVSPDGFSLLADGSSCGPLSPGVDPLPSDSASFAFTFAVSTKAGRFEIDTCCVIQSHLAFGQSNSYIVPRFTKGVIEIACDCTCHGNPFCDGVRDVVDAVYVINRAFRNAMPTIVESCLGQAGPIDGTTDLDCSGTTDVIDIVMIIDIVFRGVSLEGLICKPCG
jgi:hypothetical protein